MPFTEGSEERRPPASASDGESQAVSRVYPLQKSLKLASSSNGIAFSGVTSLPDRGAGASAAWLALWPFPRDAFERSFLGMAAVLLSV